MFSKAVEVVVKGSWGEKGKFIGARNETRSATLLETTRESDSWEESSQNQNKPHALVSGTIPSQESNLNDSICAAIYAPEHS
jgi:hypothetical protein